MTVMLYVAMRKVLAKGCYAPAFAAVRPLMLTLTAPALPTSGQNIEGS
jgi:hypothetical protein